MVLVLLGLAGFRKQAMHAVYLCCAALRSCTARHFGIIVTYCNNLSMPEYAHGGRTLNMPIQWQGYQAGMALLGFNG